MSGDALSCSACGYENVVAGCGFCLQCGAEFEMVEAVAVQGKSAQGKSERSREQVDAAAGIGAAAPIDPRSVSQVVPAQPVPPQVVPAQQKPAQPVQEDTAESSTPPAASKPSPPAAPQPPMSVKPATAPDSKEVADATPTDEPQAKIAPRNDKPVPAVSQPQFKGGTIDFQSAMETAEQCDFESGQSLDESVDLKSVGESIDVQSNEDITKRADVVEAVANAETDASTSELKPNEQTTDDISTVQDQSPNPEPIEHVDVTEDTAPTQVAVSSCSTDDETTAEVTPDVTDVDEPIVADSPTSEPSTETEPRDEEVNVTNEQCRVAQVCDPNESAPQQDIAAAESAAKTVDESESEISSEVATSEDDDPQALETSPQVLATPVVVAAAEVLRPEPKASQPKNVGRQFAPTVSNDESDVSAELPDDSQQDDSQQFDEPFDDGFDLPVMPAVVAAAKSSRVSNRADKTSQPVADRDAEEDDRHSFSKSLTRELHATIAASVEAAGMRLREEEDRLVAQMLIDGRPQPVFIDRSFTSDGTPILSLYAVCGPASSENAMPLLEWNRALALCGFAIREISEKRMFVIQANLLAYALDPMTLRKTLTEIAKRANQVNERLIS